MDLNKPDLILRGLIRLLKIAFSTPLGIVALGLSKQFYPQVKENWVDISRIDLELPHLEPEFHDYRVVQISDFHIGTWLTRKHLEQAVGFVNGLQPDLVVITGDFVSFDPESFAEDLASTLSRLAAPDGILFVLGNHDHWTDPQLIRDTLRSSGALDLSNRAITLHRGSAQLHLSGVDDYMEGLARLDHVLSSLPSRGAAILLAHEPDFADISAASGRFDLQLSGHTHGGQVKLPVLGAPILPRYGRKYSSGLYHVKSMVLYTNRGLGTAELQVRMNCRPEITLFTLKSPSAIGAGRAEVVQSSRREARST